MKPIHWAVVLAATTIPATIAEARRDWLPDGMTFYNGDFAGWSAATPGFTTIDFTGLVHGTTLYDQYADQGVLFTSWQGPPKVAAYSGFVQDGWGVDGNFHYLELTFLKPMRAAAWHHNSYWMEVYSGTELLASTPAANQNGPDGQKFGGLTSTIPFDRVRIRTPSFPGGQVWIDNVYFAEFIPAPAAWLVLPALFAAATPRRRRS